MQVDLVEIEPACDFCHAPNPRNYAAAFGAGFFFRACDGCAKSRMKKTPEQVAAAQPEGPEPRYFCPEGCELGRDGYGKECQKHGGPWKLRPEPVVSPRVFCKDCKHIERHVYFTLRTEIPGSRCLATKKLDPVLGVEVFDRTDAAVRNAGFDCKLFEQHTPRTEWPPMFEPWWAREPAPEPVYTLRELYGPWWVWAIVGAVVGALVWWWHR